MTAGSGSPVRALLVVAEPVRAGLLRERLGRIGHQVAGVVHDGAAAIAAAERLRPDIALIDLRLEGPVDGADAAARIHAAHDVPVLCLGPQDDAVARRRAAGPAAFGIVADSADDRDLAVAIDMALHRHRVERAFEESAVTHAAILAAIADGVIATDEDGRVRFLNPVAETLTGWRKVDAHGLPIDLVLPIAATFAGLPVAHPVRRALRDRVVVADPGTYALVARDGASHPVECSVAPVHASGGRISGAVVAFREVSARMRADEDLRRGEASLAEAQRIAGLGSWELDIASNTLTWSDEVFRIFEVQRRDFGATYERFLAAVHPDDRERVHRAYQVSLRDRTPYEIEHRLLMPDGRVKIVLERCRTDYDAEGRPVRSVGTVLDVTRPRRQDAERARLASIVESSQDAIISRDLTGIVLSWNRGAERLFGYTAEEMIGRDMSALVPADSADEYRASFGTLNRGEELTPFETVRIAKDGRAIDVRVSGSPLLDEFGQLAGVAMIATDIRERKKAEAERVMLAERLGQAQKLEAVGTLAGGIAHDFNNILAAIAGNAELALVDTPDDSPARESLDEVRRACQRARDLVGQILAFSRQGRLEKAVVDPRDVVAETVRMLRAIIPAGIDLVTKLDEHAPPILVDRTRLNQVVVNLCTNAWHAIGPVTGRIAITVDRATLADAAEGVGMRLPPGRYARIAIADTGRGMDAATAARIFEPFFTTKGRGEGTGLGLAVVHGIVVEHGGAIDVQTAPGAGSTFTLYFPAASQAAAAASAPREALPPPRGRGEHVLCVDDEDALVHLAKRELTRLGYRVTGFTRATEALKAIEATPDAFDLVITDQNMPSCTGVDAAIAIAALRPDLPVILTSGYVTDDLREHAVAAGVRGVVHKPTMLQELATEIRRVLDHAAGDTLAPAH